MRRIIYILFILFTLFQQSYSQAIGSWETLLSYYNTFKVTEGNSHVYAVAKGSNTRSGVEEEGGSLFSYGKEDNSIKFYSRQDGISDQLITLINYNPDINTLLIVYSNGNLDLLDDKGFYNIPHLLNNSSIKVKTINDIYFYKEYAYLPGDFGIMVLNLKKKEITDTYKLNKVITSTCIKDNYLYAVVNDGTVLRGLLSDNLLDINNWQTYPVANHTGSNIEQITLFQNTLCFRIKNKGVYYQKADGSIGAIVENGSITKMKLQNNKLIALTGSSAYICTSLTAKETVNTGAINDIASLKDDNTYWIAAGLESLKGIKKENNQYGVFFTDTLIAGNCPKRNLCPFMTTDNQRLFVAGGGRASDRLNNYGTMMVYDCNKWYNFDENKVEKQAGIKFSDVTSIAVDPNNKDHYFASTWGEGVFEFRDNECIHLYNDANSSLGSAQSGSNSKYYVRVEGLCFDKNSNLWMTNSGVTNGGIKVMKPDGTWVRLASELNNRYLIDKILITSKNKVWVNVLRPTSEIYVLDYNKTLDDPSDDVGRSYTTLINAVDKKEISTNKFCCLAEDKNGSIFIGTNNGLMICPANNDAPNTEKLAVNRVVRILEDGTPKHFLDGEQLNVIAVDGGNRKWIGTETSGIFLVNEDATETILNFTTDNSPILSNRIISLAIEPISGKVFIGTDKGIISYQGDATEGSESYSDVYAFPNPVRPEYNDQVTITGLMEESNVKITDMSGNILYQAKSVGGQLTWNCRNRSGKRVATGVYLVFAATPESKESVVTKIMVVK